MLILQPKPPPTSGAIARTWLSPTPSMPAIIVRRMCGFCVEDQSVIAPFDGSQCATTPRGSIGLGASRWLCMRCLMTTSAFLNAASTAESSGGFPGAPAPVPLGISGTEMLFGKSL